MTAVRYGDATSSRRPRAMDKNNCEKESNFGAWIIMMFLSFIGLILIAWGLDINNYFRIGFVIILFQFFTIFWGWLYA